MFWHVSVYPSVCPHLWGVPWPGPAGGVVPWPGPAWGVPHLRYPHQTWPGGVTPAGGYPTLGTSLSDLTGGYPSLGTPCHTWLEGYSCGGGGTPPQVTDGVLDMPRSVCLLRSRRTFLFLFKYDPFDLHVSWIGASADSGVNCKPPYIAKAKGQAQQYSPRKIKWNYIKFPEANFMKGSLFLPSISFYV